MIFSTIISSNKEKITKNLYLYFIAVFVVNVLFKINFLSFSSLWYDEIISVQSASLDFGHIKHVSEWDNNPPFYFYCLSVWIKLFNDSVFNIRLLSVIFSSLAAGFVFILANNYFNRITAIVSSILFLSSDILFFYSHEARAYSLILLLSLISTYYYFKFKETANLKYVVLLGIFNFLLVYTHYISGIIIVFQSILMLIYFEQRKKKLFIYSLLISIGFALLRFTKKQFLLIVAFNSSQKTFWLKKSDFNYLKEVLSEFLFSEYLVVIAFIIIIVGFLLIKLKKIKEIEFHFIYFTLVGLGSIFLLYILGKLTPIFLDRYLIFSIPFILVLLAFSLSFIKYKIIPVSISVLLALYFIPKINFHTIKTMNYRDVACFVKNEKTNSDLIIVKTKDIAPLFCYYYDSKFLKEKKKELPKADNIIFCNNWEDVYLDVTTFKRVIVIDSFQEYNANETDFVAKLTSHKKCYYTSNFYKGVRITFYN